MSDLLSIGASGVRAYQGALTTVSENITNSGVEGYSRRKTELVEVAAPSTLGVSAAKIKNGLGVATAGVMRQVDVYKAAAARSAGADLARTQASIQWLERIEGALTGAQLPARVTDFFNTARQLAADPSSVSSRVLVLEAAQATASAFRATGDALDLTQRELDENARDLTDKFDGLGRALATLNEKMGRAAPGSAALASLGDERDRLLESMSALADISASFDNYGRATVRMGGANGPVFVSGASSGDLAYSRGDTGAVSFAVYLAGDATLVQPAGGSLGAIADGAARTFDARARLADVATEFAEAVNDVQAQGRDLDGNPGAPIFAVGDPATNLTVALSDPRGIAAAGVGGGARDASNLKELELARREGGFEMTLANVTTANATALNQRKLVAQAQTAIRDGAAAARDAVSGVDLDQEAVDLIRFQQAYQASSRVIQIARETLQSILEIR